MPQVRQSVPGPKMIFFERFCRSISQKAMWGFARLIQPTYAEANRISCTWLHPTAACAAFSKESRMKFTSANELHRKSGGTWGTRPVPTGFCSDGLSKD